MKPGIQLGSVHTDARGKLKYNNDFDLSVIKRMYVLEHPSTKTIRGWQGHKIEQRWFVAVSGSFVIKAVKMEPVGKRRGFDILTFELKSEAVDVMHVPAGYATSIQALEEESKLVVYADYAMGEIEDEHRFELKYFEK